jgi:hypothetical protein
LPTSVDPEIGYSQEVVRPSYSARRELVQHSDEHQRDELRVLRDGDRGYGDGSGRGQACNGLNINRR